LTEWTVSGPEGGIAITPVTNTEYHPLREGGGATGCGIDTKVELRKISEKYHFIIDQWHCINSLEICIKYNIYIYISRIGDIIRIWLSCLGPSASKRQYAAGLNEQRFVDYNGNNSNAFKNKNVDILFSAFDASFGIPKLGTFSQMIGNDWKTNQFRNC
jgi:hypothetical protein